jgi:hypothetical protein
MLLCAIFLCVFNILLFKSIRLIDLIFRRIDFRARVTVPQLDKSLIFPQLPNHFFKIRYLSSPTFPAQLIHKLMIDPINKFLPKPNIILSREMNLLSIPNRAIEGHLISVDERAICHFVEDCSSGVGFVWIYVEAGVLE